MRFRKNLMMAFVACMALMATFVLGSGKASAQWSGPCPAGQNYTVQIGSPWDARIGTVSIDANISDAQTGQSYIDTHGPLSPGTHNYPLPNFNPFHTYQMDSFVLRLGSGGFGSFNCDDPPLTVPSGIPHVCIVVTTTARGVCPIVITLTSVAC